MKLKNKFVNNDIYGFHLVEDDKYIIVFFNKNSDNSFHIINSISNFTDFIKTELGFTEYSIYLSKITLKLDNSNISIYYKENKILKQNPDEINQIIEILFKNESSLNFLKDMIEIKFKLKLKYSETELLFILDSIINQNIIDNEIITLLKIILDNTNYIETNNLIYDKMLNLLDKFIKFFEKDYISFDKLQSLIKLIASNNIIELTDDTDNNLVNKLIKKILQLNLDIILLIKTGDYEYFLTNYNLFNDINTFKEKLISNIESINFNGIENENNDKNNDKNNDNIRVGIWYNETGLSENIIEYMNGYIHYENL